jgi:murein DD-endopeptidase MepM/ murein hydrolase activator NlpD
MIKTYVPLSENLQPKPVANRIVLSAIGESYLVRRGDTAYGIARCLQIDLSDLVALNAMEPPYLIRVGQSMLVPAGARLTQCQAKLKAGAVRTGNEEGLEPNPNSWEVKHSLLISPPAIAEDQYAVLPAPPPRAGGTFLWPVKGEIISEFGLKPGKLRNDGINIAAPIGTVVRAAENGVVAYAGNELRGYGKMLLIRHEGGWITAYAHNNELLVEQGALVVRGEVIARVGKSGGVDRPQTHFEIRRGEKAIDPDKHLSWK